MAEIRNYITNELHAPQAAHNLMLEMKNKVASLENMPERNQLVDSKKWSRQGVRRIPVKNFIMYYWVNDEQQTVHITAVVYEKRNQLRELNKMEKCRVQQKKTDIQTRFRRLYISLFSQ